MKRYKCFWNGLPAHCMVINILVHSVKEPKAHWQNAFAGELRQAIVIEQNGYSFTIDNEHGEGWHKATVEMGSPSASSHHLLGYTTISEVKEEHIRREYNRSAQLIMHETYEGWVKVTFPDVHKKMVALKSGLDEHRKKF
jgi:hypothetical protein